VAQLNRSAPASSQPTGVAKPRKQAETKTSSPIAVSSS
jgi:hypothetical protein